MREIRSFVHVIPLSLTWAGDRPFMVLKNGLLASTKIDFRQLKLIRSLTPLALLSRDGRIKVFFFRVDLDVLTVSS